MSAARPALTVGRHGEPERADTIKHRKESPMKTTRPIADRLLALADSMQKEIDHGVAGP